MTNSVALPFGKHCKVILDFEDIKIFQQIENYKPKDKFAVIGDTQVEELEGYQAIFNKNKRIVIEHFGKSFFKDAGSDFFNHLINLILEYIPEEAFNWEMLVKAYTIAGIEIFSKDSQIRMTHIQKVLAEADKNDDVLSLVREAEKEIEDRL